MANIKIYAVRYENTKGLGGEDSWKHGGRFDFTLEVDSDFFTEFCNKTQRKILERMVAEQSTEYERFEYFQHSVDFHEPYRLDENRFIAIAEEIVPPYPDHFFSVGHTGNDSREPQLNY